MHLRSTIAVLLLATGAALSSVEECRGDSCTVDQEALGLLQTQSSKAAKTGTHLSTAESEAVEQTGPLAELIKVTVSKANASKAVSATAPTPNPLAEPPAIKGDLTLEHFAKNYTDGCYSRRTRTQRAVVDAHLHPRPFGGSPVPFEDLMAWLRRSGVLFTTLYGLGQRLPTGSNCTYYLDCPGTQVKPSVKNDFDNAQSYLDAKDSLSTSKGPFVVLSMSFPDLAHPDSIVPRMKLLQKEYPGMFRWVGELNVVKQALFNNSAGAPVALDTIAKWAPFMKECEEQDIPVGFHSDLGSDAEPTKYLAQMDKILELYPNNKILWLHLGGLSKQLTPLEPALVQKPLFAPEHAKILRERLTKHSHLSIDLSWDVLYYSVWAYPEKREIYVKLINDFPDRFIPGTDFVAAEGKLEADYVDQHTKTSDVFNDVTDEAFRMIALGQNYINLLGLDYKAPKVCSGCGRTGAIGLLTILALALGALVR